MSNNYFECKQFTIQQQHSAMKVCTDACLFGAWVAARVERLVPPIKTALDIGAGTGLLGLMLAQQSHALIDAIELDEAAAEQAADNVEASPWKDRMQVIQGDARTVHLGRKYDLIISNPPFYKNDLNSSDVKRNLALHATALSLQDLLMVITTNLSEEGWFALLLPYHRSMEWKTLAHAAGFNLSEEVWVRQTPQHPYFRSMFLFSRNETTANQKELSIREGETYTTEFVELLKDYYLHL